jgi:hypothetical protein
MSLASAAKPSRIKVRERGLRPIQISVPCVRSAAFLFEAHLQSATVATNAQAWEDRAFINAMADWGDV